MRPFYAHHQVHHSHSYPSFFDDMIQPPMSPPPYVPPQRFQNQPDSIQPFRPPPPTAPTPMEREHPHPRKRVTATRDADTWDAREEPSRKRVHRERDEEVQEEPDMDSSRVAKIAHGSNVYERFFRKMCDTYIELQRMSTQELMSGFITNDGNVDLESSTREELIRKGVSRYYQFFEYIRLLGRSKFPATGGFSHMQISVCRACAQSILPYFFGVEFFRANEPRILAELGLTTYSSNALLATARRMGKSECIAASVAAMLFTVPKFKIIVFSTGKRASKSLKELIMTYVSFIPGSLQRILTKNEEELTIRGDDVNDVRKLLAFPSNSVGLRGQGGDCLILEEAAYCDDKMYLDNVLPLWGVGETAIIGISTINSDPDNFFSRMLRITNAKGELMFRVYHFQLVCPECRERFPDKTDVCFHRRHLMPPWKSESRQKDIARLMEGHEDAIRTELMGEFASDEGIVFEKERVLAALDMYAHLSVPQRDYHPYLFIGLDPNAFGGGSSFAFVSMVFMQDKYWIAGMECEGSSTVKTMEEQKKLLTDHVLALQDEFLFLCDGIGRLVFMPENNLGLFGVTLYEHLKIQPNIRCNPMLFNPKGSPIEGVRTTQQTKEQGVELMRRALHADRLAFGKKIVCIGKAGNPRAVDRPPEILREFVEEATHFKRIRKTSANNPDLITIKYSGKGQGGTNRDDLIMAFLITLYFSNLFPSTKQAFEDMHKLSRVKIHGVL